MFEPEYNFLPLIIKLVELESYHFNLIVDESEKNSIVITTYTITKVNFSTPLFYYISLQIRHYFFQECY